jgi:lipoate-protein ligase A
MSPAMKLRHARMIDVGVLEPAQFHATYAGLALALDADAAPVVMWGRSRPHVSLGQAGARAVLDPDLDVPVVRRPLGGGAVWIDEQQHCFVLIAPLSRAPRRPGDWFEWGLRPAAATYRRFGLEVVRIEQDLWLGGRKIAGSGAATLGTCAVFASSFMFRFPAGRFARCMRAPSSSYRAWLAAGLARTMTDWESHQQPPQPPILARAFRHAVREELGWGLARSALSVREGDLCAAALRDLGEDDSDAGVARMPGSIKLNATSFLTETRSGAGTSRALVVGGTVVLREFTAVAHA